MEKQKWVDEILQSTDGMSRADAPDTTGAVLSRIGRDRYMTGDNSLVWRIAASVILLMLLNAMTIYSYQTNVIKAEQEHRMHEAADELGMGHNGSDLGTAIFGR